MVHRQYIYIYISLKDGSDVVTRNLKITFRVTNELRNVIELEREKERNYIEY